MDRERQRSPMRNSASGIRRFLPCFFLLFFAFFGVQDVSGQALDSARRCAREGDWHSVYRVLDRAVVDCDTCYEERALLAESMVMLRRELARAEIILGFQERSPRILLLLAEAQRQQYRFSDAEKTYQEYVSLGDFSVLSRAKVTQLMASCQSGEQLCMSGVAPWCAYRVKVRRDAVPGVVDTGGREYALVPLPSALMGEYDRLDSGHAAWLAYPRALAAGGCLVFPRRQFANGPHDLYVTEQGGDGLWTQPVSVGAIVNSPYDESFAVLASDGKTLYFSSSGHYGLGGQDIFKSVYDSRVGQWSAPENMGFPYNSPADDYLIGIPNARGEVLVASNRNAGGDSLYVYSLEYDSRAAGSPVADPQSRYIRARFDDAGRPRKSKRGAMAVRADATLAVAAPGSSFREVEQDPEYRSALASGYAQQRLADSLRRDLERLREQAWDAKTVKQRRALEQRIEPIEKSMLQAQRKADEHFVRASFIEQAYILGTRTLPHEAARGAGGGFSSDDPPHLYLAQLSPTVFQRDEIAELEQASKGARARMQEVRTLLHQQKEYMALLSDTNATTMVLAMGEESIAQSARAFVEKYGEGTAQEQQIYQQCLPVALMKSNRNEQAHVRASDSKARDQYRMARSVENNSDPRAEWQSKFNALVLTMLGNRYMELGFSYVWNMTKYRERVQRQIDTLSSWLMPGAERVQASSDRHALGSPSAIRLAVPKVSGLTIETPSRYTESTPVPRDEELPRGVVYKLQLGAYTNPVDPSLFRGMYPVSAVTANGGRVTKYYAGFFREKSEADKGKAIAAQCGFGGAFVVAWYDGREVPIARARALETAVGEAATPPREEESGAYRVEVGAFEGPLPAYVRETLHLLAPGKEVQKRPGAGGKWVYSVGVFSLRSDAERLCNNLMGSGLTSAKVLEAAN